jgi:hypothetical protein
MLQFCRLIVLLKEKVTLAKTLKSRLSSNFNAILAVFKIGPNLE